MSDLSRAEHWRQRAQELRAIADSVQAHDPTREKLMQFADDLGEMAEDLECAEKGSVAGAHR
jgi:hypothetical protein